LAVEKLKKRSFFKRFSSKKLLKYIDHFKVKQHAYQTLIFVEKEAAIILEGTINVRNQTKSLYTPDVLATLKPGDILGMEELDRGLTTISDAWNMT
jgi:hypothetical protein